MSHERTITIEADGKFYVIPSVRGGKQLSPKAAWDAARNTQSWFGVFKSEREANDYAKRRSRGFPITAPAGKVNH